MIDFSKLPQKEKEKYIQFLVENNVEFKPSDSGYLANVKMNNKENVDPYRKQSQLGRRSVSPVQKRLGKETLLAFIQELYSQMFEEANSFINKREKASENNLNQFANKIAKERMIDLNGSLCIQNENVDLFKKFLNGEYDDEDLMFYLFVRAIIEKEIGQPIYKRSNVLDISNKYLSQKQIQAIGKCYFIIKLVQVICDEEDIDELYSLISSKMVQKRMSIFEFLKLTLQKYQRDKHQSPNYNEQIIENVFMLLDKFFMEQLEMCELEPMTKVKLVVNDLLESIFKNDKSIWLKRVQNQSTTDMNYLDQLQQQLLTLQPQEITYFSKKVLQTPSLGRILGSILEND